MVEAGARPDPQEIERVVRSDSGVAHRLSLSARVVSAGDSQVKAKRQGQKRLWRLQNRHSAASRKGHRKQPCGRYARGQPNFIRVIYAKRGARSWVGRRSSASATPASPNRCCAQPPMTARTGLRPAASAAAARFARSDSEIPRSILVVVVIIIIVVIVIIVGLSRGFMRYVALIVPEIAIHPALCQQLLVRTALGRLAA